MPESFRQAFPLTSKGTPAVKWSDPATCVPWAWNDITVGLPTGERNGVWILDLDRKNGKDGLKELVAYAAGRETPDTFTVRTPSGGLHLYFAWDPSHPVGNRAGILPGVDVRGHGGFVRAGGAYTVIDPSPAAPAPAWLLEFVGRREEVTGESAVAIGMDHPEYPARLAMAAAFVNGEPPCISGQGGQAQLWKMGLRLMRTYELPVDIAVEMLGAYNLHCVPPWSDEELRRTMVRASEAGHGPTGTFSAGFLGGGPAPGKSAEGVPEPIDDGPWRRVRDPQHQYLVNLASAAAGAPQKGHRAGPQELASNFLGPGATPGWRGVWQYDDFAHRILAVNPPFKLDAETTGVSHADLCSLQLWLACVGSTASTEIVANAIAVASKGCSFHPVRDYLDSLPYVDVEEARRYFQGSAGRLWGASPDRDALESSHLTRFAIAAVRRIRCPGTKVDAMLVLAGGQGYRKSLFCAHLFGQWFLDQMPSLEKDKEASIALEGFWGVEFAELRALAKVADATRKDFISRCIDKYRPVYDKQLQVFPRQCVFICTTNQDDFLTDATGDTRYDVCDIVQPIALESLDRDVFWACANALEAAGESHFRDRALQATPEKSAEEYANFAHEDVWTSDVLKYAATKAGATVTTADCLKYGLTMATDRQDDRARVRVNGILRRAFGAATVVRHENRAQRAYKVPAAPAAPPA